MASIPNFYRGDSVSYEFTFKDKNSDPVDISNTVLWFTMKKDATYPDSSAALQQSVTFPADADSIAGLGRIDIPASSTSTLSVTNYYYDFQWVNAGTVVTLTAGNVSVLQDITVSTS